MGFSGLAAADLDPDPDPDRDPDPEPDPNPDPDPGSDPDPDPDPCRQVLPAATHRGGRLFQDIYDKDEIVVLREPLSTLFDVDHLMQWANARDATFHRVRRSTVIASCTPRGVDHRVRSSVAVKA